MNILWDISRHLGLSKMRLLDGMTVLVEAKGDGLRTGLSDSVKAALLMNVVSINRQMMSGRQQNPDTGRTNRAQ